MCLQRPFQTVDRGRPLIQRSIVSLSRTSFSKLAVAAVDEDESARKKTTKQTNKPTQMEQSRTRMCRPGRTGNTANEATPAAGVVWFCFGRNLRCHLSVLSAREDRTRAPRSTLTPKYGLHASYTAEWMTRAPPQTDPPARVSSVSEIRTQPTTTKITSVIATCVFLWWTNVSCVVLIWTGI